MTPIPAGKSLERHESEPPAPRRRRVSMIQIAALLALLLTAAVFGGLFGLKNNVFSTLSSIKDQVTQSESSKKAPSADAERSAAMGLPTADPTQQHIKAEKVEKRPAPTPIQEEDSSKTPLSMVFEEAAPEKQDQTAPLTESKNQQVRYPNKQEEIQTAGLKPLKNDDKNTTADMEISEHPIIRFPGEYHKGETHPEIEKWGTLDKVFQAIRDCKGQIVISGHTCSLGESETNNYVSLRRAEVVARYFVKRGFAKQRLLVQGMGATMPIADNETEEGRTKNRRVDISCR